MADFDVVFNHNCLISWFTPCFTAWLVVASCLQLMKFVHFIKGKICQNVTSSLCS